MAVGSATAATVPTRDTVVETQLAPRVVKAQVQQRALAAQAPAAQRIAQARALIEINRVVADPRLLGYAEAQLAGLRDVEADVLRAAIEQSRHRFDVALALLDDVLQQQPRHLQALLLRASILQVRGELAAARSACVAIAPLASTVAAVCTAGVDAASGRVSQALAVLQTVAAGAPPPLRGWVLSLAGEAHERRGDFQAAVRAYTQSLAAREDLYTRVALADAWFALGDARQARATLADAPASDAVLLRRWRIARQLGEDAQALATELAERFAAAAARGELLHAREAGWFALERGDARTALWHARANWTAQREPADALLLAAAARAAGDDQTLREVRAWLARTGLSDARIARILSTGAGP